MSVTMVTRSCRPIFGAGFAYTFATRSRSVRLIWIGIVDGCNVEIAFKASGFPSLELNANAGSCSYPFFSSSLTRMSKERAPRL